MEKQNKFVVITTCYNKEKWVGFNINSVKQQSYKNFLAIYGYDKSQDNTRDEIIKHIGSDERFILYDVPVQQSQINNFCSSLDYLKENNLISDEDIIVEVDADDWLLHPFIFDHLNDIYQDPEIWMTYGQYVEYPNGNVGGHYQLYLDDAVDAQNNYRNSIFPYSHLKTYKVWLFNKVPKTYLINPETGKYWTTTADFAMCMPMVEMAGKKHIYRIDDPIYVYNTSEEAESESRLNLFEQKRAEQIIRQFPPLQKI
jgi:glycosyltransferase involved in cell wall biosynthesis